MLNRRYIRVKVFQALYAYFQSNRDIDREKIEKDLIKSINEIYDLYVYMMLLLVEFRDVAQGQLDQAKQKRLATDEDLNPNTRFVENKVLTILDQNVAFKKHVEAKKLSWYLEESLVKKMWTKAKESETFTKYMQNTDHSFKSDKSFLTDMYKEIVWEFELLHHHLEEKSIYWMDDLAVVNVNVLKTITQLKEDAVPTDNVLIDLYKDKEDDVAFVKNLFRRTIAHNDSFEGKVKEVIQNWEADRIATLDFILMKMALCEMMYFNSIPVKVSLNEYIELSKDYSTPKSKIFINGILDKLANLLKAKGELVKTGRGLVE